MVRVLRLLVLQMHDVDPLSDVSCSDVRHHVRCLLAAELAVRTLEPWGLSAFVLEVPRHITLDGEVTAAFWAAERFFAFGLERGFHVLRSLVWE